MRTGQWLLEFADLLHSLTPIGKTLLVLFLVWLGMMLGLFLVWLVKA